MTETAAAPRRGVRTVTVAAVLFLLLLLGIAGARSLQDLERARRREAELESKIEATRERVDALEHRIHRLRDDPLLLEQLAREELGMVRDGDVVVMLDEEEPEGEGGAVDSGAARGAAEEESP